MKVSLIILWMNNKSELLLYVSSANYSFMLFNNQ